MGRYELAPAAPGRKGHVPFVGADMRTDVPSLRGYLEAPQFPDEEPPTEEDLAGSGLSLARFTGGWVAAGQPRWKAFAIYLASILGGVILAFPGPDDLGVLAIAGVAFFAFGVFGIAETLRGKRFPRP
jgi:hypothetical protein